MSPIRISSGLYGLTIRLFSAVLPLLVLLLQTLTARAQTVVLDKGQPLAGQMSPALSARGVANTLAGVAQAESATSAGRRPLWIAPHYGTCLADDASTITAHIKQGGAFLMLGDAPFQQLLYPWGNDLVSEAPIRMPPWRSRP